MTVDGGPDSGGGDAGSTSTDSGSSSSDSGNAAEGGGSDGGNCAGMAISLDLNVPTANDPAAQRVMADLGADLPIGNASRTIEWWAYVLSTSWVGDANTMFEYGDQKVTNGGFGFDFGTNQTAAMGTIDPYTNGTFDNDNQPSGITNPGTSQWIHFALSWDGTAFSAFVNGVETATKTGGGMLATDATQLTIGGNPRGAYFNGNMDEFRVWNIARTAADITSTMHKTLTGTETGLVGYWKFDETTGMTAADSTTTAGHMAHNGTLMSATGFALPKWIPSTAPINCP
jgi:hypothetical protein